MRPDGSKTGVFHQEKAEQMSTASISAALVVMVATLWIRRLAWRCRYEAAVTANVAAQVVCLLLIAPAITDIVGPPLHTLTGRWNVEDLLGHLAYLTGIATLTHTMLGRLQLTEEHRHQLTRSRLELPATIVVPTLIGMFWLAAPQTHIADLVAAPANGWMAGYWLLLCAASAWVLCHLLRVLFILRGDRRSTRVANIYIASIGIDLLSLTSLCVSVAVPSYPRMVSWVLMCTAVAGYGVAASYSWRRRVAWFGLDTSGRVPTGVRSSGPN